MRLVWFDVDPNPTKVEIILQVKEVVDLDLSSEVLDLNAVIDRVFQN